MQYLLDTSICVFYLRGKLNLDEIIRDKGLENVFISEITVIELTFGAENSQNSEKAHKAVKNFVDGLSVLPIFGSIRRYAKEKVRLRRMGIPMNDEFDLLIAATAVENNLILVTDNIKHFKSIEAIQIENWYKHEEQ